MKLKEEVPVLKKRWRNLYDSFRKCQTREKELSVSGTAFKKMARCKFYDELLFLKGIISGKTTHNDSPSSPTHSIPNTITEYPSSPPVTTSTTSIITTPAVSSRKKRKLGQNSSQSLAVDTFESSVVAAIRGGKRSKKLRG